MKLLPWYCCDPVIAPVCLLDNFLHTHGWTLRPVCKLHDWWISRGPWEDIPDEEASR